METINITEEQKSNLCNEIAGLVAKYKSDQNVECIYFAPYKGLGEIECDVVELTLVLDRFPVLLPGESPDDIKECNEKYQSDVLIKALGVRLVVDIDQSSRYPTLPPMHRYEMRRANDLFNSTILFDRVGKYTRMKEFVQKWCDEDSSFIYYYDNAANIVPPVEYEIYRQMEVLELKQENGAVKKFTKSSLFKNIQDM